MDAKDPVKAELVETEKGEAVIASGTDPDAVLTAYAALISGKTRTPTGRHVSELSYAELYHLGLVDNL